MSDVLVTGGGSGGHVAPAIAVGQRLQASGSDVVFVGSNSGLEKTMVEPAGLRYRGVSAGKLRRYFSWQNVSDAVRVLAGLVQALWVVWRERPLVVFSKGGFVAFPVVVAAWVWRIPVVAHESDATQGLANRLSAPFVRTLCTGFPHTKAGRFKGRFVYAGAPLRPELLRGDARAGRVLAGADEQRHVLLVTGGSLGADALNEALLGALSRLEALGWFVIHITGAGKRRGSDSDSYRAFEFVSEGWADLLAAADVVVSRAGANTVFELLALGKPNLLVPLPATGSRGDQLDNAQYAQSLGYSSVLPQESLNSERLIAEITSLWQTIDQSRAHLAGFERPDALATIEAELRRLAPALPAT